jgi:small-conductance mechanosensitive channel
MAWPLHFARAIPYPEATDGMMQIPLPDTAALDLQLPQSIGRWRDLYVHGFAQQLLVFFILAIALYLIARVARRVIAQQVADVNQRHALRKWVGYSYGLLLLLFAVALFADALAGVGTLVAVVLAGVAIALQDVLKSVVGWIYIAGRSGVQIGSRVEVGGVIGDVIDIGFFKTTVLEVGNLVYGRQSTGRLATIPNSLMISANVFMSTESNPFVWQEVRLVTTFESDWERAEEILREVAGEIHEEIAPELAQGFQKLERRYAFKYGALTPIVYLSLADYGVQLDLRFLVPVRRRRGSVDRVTRRILTAFAAEPSVRIAYPTYRIYQAGGAPSAAGAPTPTDLPGTTH